MKLVDADKLIKELSVDPVECPGCPEPEWLGEFVRILEEAEEVKDARGFLALDMANEKVRCSVCNSILDGCKMINEKETEEEASVKPLLGDRIAKLLRDRNMSQREFAEKIEMTDVSVSRYINNSRLPNANVVVRMSKALGISADELLGISDV